MVLHSADPEQTPPAPTNVTLPPTFGNSFWSSDYRTGITALFDALDNGVVASQELVDNVAHRAATERDLASRLRPPALRDDGFGADEGASLRLGFEAVLTSQVSEARARQALADDLQRTILTPFTAWSASHSSRLSQSRSTLFPALEKWERHRALVERLQRAYVSACRDADAVEDEVNFSRAREEVGGEREGRALPPRPEEIDAVARREAEKKRREREEDEKSVDGPDSESEEEDRGPDDDDDRPLRSPTAAAAAQGVIGALGRAFTVRRGAASGRGGQKKAPEGEKKEDDDDEEDEKAREAAAERERLVKAAKEGVEGARESLKKLVESEEAKKAVEWSKSTFNNLLSRVGAAGAHGSPEERLARTRKAADEAEEKYKKEVDVLDGLRLTLESTLSSHLPYLQRIETDRLRAAASVLRSFHAATAALAKAVAESQERVGGALELVRAEKDVRGLIERRRAGPFLPRPTLYTSHYADPPSHTFGIDLLKFDETNPAASRPDGTRKSEREMSAEEVVPPVLRFLVRWVEEDGKKVPEEERLKSWLYETPLSAQHRLRTLLNSPSTLALPFSSLSELLSRSSSSLPTDPSVIDLPLACSLVKLWLLELEVPVVSYERYEELKGLFGAAAQEGREVATEEVAGVLGRLPRVHFEVLSLLLTHLSSLLPLTSSPAHPTQLAKLALSLSRPLARPRLETPLTLDDRFPARLVGFLLLHWPEVKRAAEEKGRREREERYRPRRQRTKPVDVRATRSNLGLGPSGTAAAVPALPARLAFDEQAKGKQGEELEEKPKEEGRRSLLGVDTAVGGALSSGEFAASPLSVSPAQGLPSPPAPAPAGEEKEEEEEPVKPAEEEPVQPAEKEKSSLEEVKAEPGPPAAPSAPGANEPPFTPPASSPPPSSSSVHESTPLAPSSSLKRSSHTASAPSSSSSRLRGARAPRPAGAGGSSGNVLAAVAAFEGGAGGGPAGKGEGGKRESWTRSRAAEDDVGAE